MANILVVSVDIRAKKEDLDRLRDDILAQKETGVVLLPCFCRALVVPDNVEVLVEDYKGEVLKGNENI